MQKAPYSRSRSPHSSSRGAALTRARRSTRALASGQQYGTRFSKFLEPAAKRLRHVSVGNIDPLSMNAKTFGLWHLQVQYIGVGTRANTPGQVKLTFRPDGAFVEEFKTAQQTTVCGHDGGKSSRCWEVRTSLPLRTQNDRTSMCQQPNKARGLYAAECPLLIILPFCLPLSRLLRVL